MLKRKIVIDPKHSELKEWVENLPSRFNSEGVRIWHRRNEVKLFDVEGRAINVKRYCIPPFFFNRIIYLFFRAPKAERAYQYALHLLSEGVGTAAPIAYIVEHNWLLIKHSYFVSEHLTSHSTLRDIETTEGGELLCELGRFTAMLHSKGIYHRDYSSDNILYRIVQGRPHFCLVDINRMFFGEIDFELGCRAFERLLLSEQQLEIVGRAYAAARNFDPDKFIEKIMRINAIYRVRYNRKRCGEDPRSGL